VTQTLEKKRRVVVNMLQGSDSSSNSFVLLPRFRKRSGGKERGNRVGRYQAAGFALDREKPFAITQSYFSGQERPALRTGMPGKEKKLVQKN